MKTIFSSYRRDDAAAIRCGRGPVAAPRTVVALMVMLSIALLLVACGASGAPGAPGGPTSIGAPSAYQTPTPTDTRTPVSRTVYTQVTGIGPQTVATVGAGGIANPLQAAPANTPIYTDASGNKPIVLYVGAEYCPYCAAERWSLVAALGRFGTFSGLKEMTSSDTDTPASVPTFSFEGATYTSQYITFIGDEIQDRNGQNLGILSVTDTGVFNTYDGPPYVQSNSAGGIPFVSYGNQYLTHSAGYVIQLLNGQTRDSVAAQLDDPKSPITQAIVGNANWLTAAICKLTNNQPASVCGAAPIPALEQQLPAGK